MALNCTLCDRVFFKRSILVDHYLTHSFGDEMFRCPRCEYTSATMDLLLQHASARHPASLPCPLCPFTAETKKELSMHRKRHRLDYIFRCEICPYVSRYRGTLNRHMRIHSEEKPFSCEHCIFRAKHKTTLTAHQYAKHFDCKKYECEICHKPFVTAQNLQVHELIHTDERPYVCQICDRRFRQRQHLESHYTRKHT